MSMYVAFAILCVLQAADQNDSTTHEKISLAWSYQVGQKREFSWDGRFKVETTIDDKETPSSDVSFQMKGTVTITEVDGDGTAKGDLQLHYQCFKGIFQGRPMDNLVVDSKLRKPEGEIPEAARPFFDAMLGPAKVLMTRRGSLEVDSKHPFFGRFNSLWPMMGPILPAQRKVAIGHAWTAPLQSPEMKAKGEDPVSVEYSFPECVERNGRKYAHITLSTNKAFRMGGADMTLNAKSDGLFDTERGECVRDKLTGDTGGTMRFQGRKYDMKGSFALEFELLPPKK